MRKSIRDKNPDLKLIINRVFAAIEKVHGVHDLPDVPIELSSRLSAEGMFYWNTSGQVQRIEISRNALQPELTLAHEIGHLLDAAGLPPTGGYASDSAADSLTKATSKIIAMRGVLKAIQQSEAAKKLYDVVKRKVIKVEKRLGTGYNNVAVNRTFVADALAPHEMFARTYSQYIAQRSNDETLLHQIDQRRRKSHGAIYYPTQWDKFDFAPIADAMDQLMMEAGWLKP